MPRHLCYVICSVCTLSCFLFWISGFVSYSSLVGHLLWTILCIGWHTNICIKNVIRSLKCHSTRWKPVGLLFLQYGAWRRSICWIWWTALKMQLKKLPMLWKERPWQPSCILASWRAFVDPPEEYCVWPWRRLCGPRKAPVPANEKEKGLKSKHI